MLVHIDMTMIPHSPGGIGDELIGKAVTGLDAELGHVWNPVHFPCPALQNAVPMDRMRQRRQIVENDLDLISFPHVE